MKTNTLSHTLLLGLGLSLLLTGGCIPYTQLVNFSADSSEAFVNAQYVQDPPQITIQPDDILAITVSTFDSLASMIFNKPLVPAGTDGSFIGQGYLVDQNGYIEFPVVGRILLKGLTRDQAKDTIRTKILTYLRDPIVEVRFLNLHVSVLGEVARPGVYTFPDEKFTILEALSLAGDMTTYADRSEILVIREYGKVREFGKVDLLSSRAFESPYFYLTQNDVVYVKPLEQKKNLIEDPLSRALAIASALASITTVVIALSRI
ncbi:MAG: polysaccharide biosynthesis protein [Saprospiraceae bacterium]|nr:MAG: polysaccharide biosynthesis protein [Saprospiraceae bacterium]